MNLAANALGLVTVLLLASAVCPQDHTVSPRITHDAPLPDLISPTVWPPAVPRTAGQPTESMGPTISVAEMRVPSAARKELTDGSEKLKSTLALLVKSFGTHGRKGKGEDYNLLGANLALLMSAILRHAR